MVVLGGGGCFLSARYPCRVERLRFRAFLAFLERKPLRKEANSAEVPQLDVQRVGALSLKPPPSKVDQIVNLALWSSGGIVNYSIRIRRLPGEI